MQHDAVAAAVGFFTQGCRVLLQLKLKGLPSLLASFLPRCTGLAAPPRMRSSRATRAPRCSAWPTTSNWGEIHERVVWLGNAALLLPHSAK